MTGCTQSQFEFTAHSSRQVVVRFDGGSITTECSKKTDCASRKHSANRGRRFQPLIGLPQQQPTAVSWGIWCRSAEKQGRQQSDPLSEFDLGSPWLNRKCDRVGGYRLKTPIFGPFKDTTPLTYCAGTVIRLRIRTRL